jgi:hypothetical protein
MPFFCLLITLFLSTPSFAIELLFGPEFTFSSSEILRQQPPPMFNCDLQYMRSVAFNNPALKDARQHYLEIIRDRLFMPPNSRPLFAHRMDRQPDDNRNMYFNDDFHFTVSTDPAVIELTTSPMTIRQAQKHSKRLQEILFDWTAEAQATPQMFAGGGHINIGLAEFSNNPLLFRNFIIDLLNHNELFLGVFGYDTANAASHWMIPKTTFDLFLKRLNEATSYNHLDKINFVTLQAAIELTRITDRLLAGWAEKGLRAPNLARMGALAFNVRVDPHKSIRHVRLEIRAVRPQKNFAQYLRQIQLLQARVNYLSTLTEPLELKAKVEMFKQHNEEGIEDYIFNPPVNPQEALKAFYEYVTESGELWANHRDYLWPNWITNGDLDRFEAAMGLSGSESCSTTLTRTGS